MFPDNTRKASTGALAALSIAGLVAGLAAVTQPATAAPLGALPTFEVSAEVPFYAVTSAGLNSDDAKALAERAKVKAEALDKFGSFNFVSPAHAAIPSVRGVEGRDEDGRTTVAQKINFEALKQRSAAVLDEESALKLGSSLMPEFKGFDLTPRVSHTTAEVKLKRSRSAQTYNLDTSVSFDFSLGQVPVVGPGAKARISFGAGNRVTNLVATGRTVEREGFVGIIGPEAAAQQCAELSGPDVKQGEPQLVYLAPALNREVKYLLPHYACQSSDLLEDGVSNLVGRLVPAAPELTPQILIGMNRDGSAVKAEAKVDGGTAPYTIQWSSSSISKALRGEAVGYDVGTRARKGPETLTATVTDANGISSVASVTLGAEGGSGEASGYGGAGGAFASVGIEQTVDEWQCAQDSANGFKSVMQSKSQTVRFDWRGMSAWERDFKKTSIGGQDDRYVDAVDAQWYTGHGWPGGFTFKSAVNDGSIVPSDARWGDNFNLEWMQLESCQVLRDTTGSLDFFGRWDEAFDGLHLLNGFDTNAYCIGGGTGRRFAEYLFPTFWRGALSVSSAWSTMANDLEPSGVKWRSMSPIGSGGVHNLNDRFWGQGATGPDIPAASQIGFIAISGTV